jgi:radical SAM superfamily enzyme YgiQ (UPF0313 family)
MEILLIQPPIRDFYFTKKRSIPYGLLTIATALKKESFEISLLDCLATKKSKNIPWPSSIDYLKEFYGRSDFSSFSLFHHFIHFGYSFQHISAVIKRSNAKIFGISSLFTAYSNEAITIAKMIKDIDINHVTIVGGHHPTNLPESVLNESSVDFIIRGEGEKPFTQLAKALRDKEDYSNIKGIGFKKNGKNKSNGVYEIKDPKNILKPDLTLLNHKFYSRFKSGSSVVVSSRGCPMKCKYCCVTSAQSSYRIRPVESVIEEIKSSVIDYGTRFVDFEDENLSLNKKWFINLLEQLRENFSEFSMEYRAMNGLFPPSLSPSIIKEMKLTGFKTLNLSLGTISEDGLNIFGRPDLSDSLISVIKEANKNSLDTVTYIITGAPGQKPLDSVKDLIFLSYLETVLGVSVYYPAPGSAMYNDLNDTDRLPKTFDLYRSSFIPISDTFDRVETVTILRLGRIINHLKLKKSSKLLQTSPDVENDLIVNEFLKDGKIRGVDENGNIYIHKISNKLTDAFLDKFDISKLKSCSN